MLKGIAAGVAATLLAGLIGAYAFIVSGRLPANADAPPPRLEKWAARKSLRAAIRREAPKGPAPLAATDDNLIAGVRLYAANCAVCHGAADGKASNIAVGLYQEAPQLAKDGVEDDPTGGIYWKIAHGIRMTGMPSFRKTLADAQIWQVALFLKRMDSLPAAADRAWKSVPSAAPAPAP